jgi:hypothetical protein
MKIESLFLSTVLTIAAVASASAAQPTVRSGGVTRLAPARQSSHRQTVTVNSVGRTALAPNRPSSGGLSVQSRPSGGTRSFFAEWNSRFWDFGPSKPAVSGFSRGAVAGARGRVSVRETGFERQVKAFNGGSTYPSLATGVPQGTYIKPVLSGSATVVGAGQFRSGLDLVHTRRRR